MENHYREYLDFAKGIAMHAGEIMLKYFNAKDISKYKGDRSIVTLADTEINSYLIEQVKAKYPTHAVDGEEEKYGTSNLMWLCDPVDGTAQFARGIPVAVDGVPIVGVVYDPFVKEMFWAVKGQGAYKNGEKISVNDIPLDDNRAMGSYDMFPVPKLPIGVPVCDVYKAIEKLDVYSVSIGSCIRSCTAVADGHYVFHLFPSKKYVDISAVKVIVEEAGGMVRNFYGDEQRYDKEIIGAIVSNKVAYDDVLKVIKKIMGVCVA